ncbi:hypothetical protein BC941DRAFT_449490 [Chlamydoabsidia padenii]|nr:hypothetical protein BC941DRAFT_449490 [Chlamydoabsidia padenii]
MTPYAHTLRSMSHSLKELTLRNNAFVEFPTEVLVLNELTSFSIAKNQLTKINVAVFPPLSHLTWLSLSHNQLESLPDDLACCHHLQGLDLSNNKFHDLPAVISQLSQLQILLIQKNHLSHLSKDIPSFPSNLQTLNLAFNQFHTVPLCLIHNPPGSLTHLHLSGNPLKSLPVDFLRYGYKHLVSLDLHTCQLTHVSPIFFTFQTPLRRLNLAINQLREIPSTIGLATQLQWLNLNDNRLVTLPPSMARLVHLVKLGLVQNHLKILPPYLFAHMSCLEKIDLRRNQLVYLPPSILSLAPEQEIHQHVDLAVPSSLCPTIMTNGALKTLLLYENSYLEQKDGIFCCMDQEEEKEATFQLISLEEIKSFSNPADLAHALLQSDVCHSSALHYRPSSLKNLALRRHLSSTNKLLYDDDWAFLGDAFPTWAPPLLYNQVIQTARSATLLAFVTIECKYLFGTRSAPLNVPWTW